MLFGVVGAEMPAEFSLEAQKAQAVAARTYALKKSEAGVVLSATTADQVYKTDEQLKKDWGSNYSKYINKVRNAVSSTKSKVMLYGGKYIDAVYFSTSNGKTEDSKEVWGNGLPYLKSVDSPHDKNISNFISTKSISMSEISSKLGVNLTSVSQINISAKTSSGRVKTVNVAGKSFTGIKIRSLLNLRSTDFSVSQEGNSIKFTTKGFGHGVGMSQNGANQMAKKGSTYKEILNHYYTGISIVSK